MKRLVLIAIGLLLSSACAWQAGREGAIPSGYFENTGREGVLTGGVRMIPVTTPKGEFRVWTKRVGNNPDIKVLILHGGPGFTHEYLEVVDSFFPGAGIEYYHYDQLGSYYSDQPNDPELLSTARFVQEVEQVRRALELGPDNFYLFGHSWGGLLAIEYALKHQDNLKGLVISNMMASIPAYNRYAEEELMPAMDQEALEEIKKYEEAGFYDNPHYQDLLMEHHYVDHVLRMPPGKWPDPLLRSMKHLNSDVYIPMQGPSELGASGILENWDRTADLKDIHVPTLVIGARHDTMDPEHMKWMAKQLPNGRYLYCPDGSHLAFYDDQQVYFDGLIQFIKDVDAGRF